MAFFQSPPILKNQYDSDRILKSYLRRSLPPAVLKAVEPDLQRFGFRVVSDILAMGEEAEANPPVHIPYGPWGKRIDEVKTSQAWKMLDRVSAEEGLVSIGYERKFQEHSRLYQFAKLYLFHPSSAIYSCPLAMTDGAARVLELHGSEDMKNRALKHLTSRDPESFWTSGQWMTERSGGSDVSGTATEARLINGKYYLHGVKWFTSATTSQMAMTLARIQGNPSGKLSLFYLELRNSEGELQNIQINRLKDKLGTRALPTAELTLEGVPAVLVGEEEKGIKTIATLFNITRVYNACCALGYMRRGIALATDYASRREAFGKKLIEHGLHVETLASLQVRFEASFHLTFHTIGLLGKEESGINTKNESSTLRLLIPLAKLFTAKEGISITSEVLECFGGAGYVEDTGLPSLLRNAQVLSIWEGTTNVLSLDVLRAIRKEQAGEAFLIDVEQRLETISHEDLKKSKEEIRHALNKLKAKLESFSKLEDEDINSNARTLAFNLARIYCASLIIEHAQWGLTTENDNCSVIVLKRWIQSGLFENHMTTEEVRADSLALLV